MFDDFFACGGVAVSFMLGRDGAQIFIISQISLLTIQDSALK